MNNSSTWFRRHRLAAADIENDLPHVTQRLLDLRGKRLRKPRRDAKATVRFHMERWERAERERQARAAANRLQRAMERAD